MSQNVPPTGKTEAVTALATGHTITEAAEAAGVDRRTVHRWLNEPGFRTEVTQRRGQILDHVVGGIIAAATEAVATLRRALNDESSAVQVRAARELLSALISVRESADLEARIAALEAEQLEGDST